MQPTIHYARSQLLTYLLTYSFTNGIDSAEYAVSSISSRQYCSYGAVRKIYDVVEVRVGQKSDTSRTM